MKNCQLFYFHYNFLVKEKYNIKNRNIRVGGVFVENKYILSKIIINAVDKYSFTYLPLAKREKNIIKKIVSFIYKDNMQIRKKRDLFIFYKVNLLLLWFFNMVSYNRCLILICFVNNFIFVGYTLNILCYDNYFYNLYTM